MLFVSPKISIPERELLVSAARSSGPGGQRVNKADTRAVLRWNVRRSHSLPDDVRTRFLNRYGSRLTKDGTLILESQTHRNHAANAKDCRQRLKSMLLSVASPAVPRKPSRPTRGSVRRRLQQKRKHSERKRFRKKIRPDDRADD